MAFDLGRFRLKIFEVQKRKCEVCRKGESKYMDKISKYLDQKLVKQINGYGVMIWKDIYVCAGCVKKETLMEKVR